LPRISDACRLAGTARAGEVPQARARPRRLSASSAALVISNQVKFAADPTEFIECCGVLSNPVQPNRTPNSEHDTAQVAENCVRPRRDAEKPGKRARRISVSRSEEEAAVRAFLAQLIVGPGRKTQAAELLREDLRRARVQGWPMLNKTAFGLLITKLVRERGFEKLKEGKVTMYYGVGVAINAKVDLAAAA
jgi:hypothetical protein